MDQQQFGQSNDRQARIEKFIKQIVKDADMDTGQRWAIEAALGLLSNPENSDVLDAVNEIYGEKRAQAFVDSLSRIGANETHE
jgi:hypothetical protein